MWFYIKLIVWIIMCSVLGACRIDYPYGVTPDLLFSFVICYCSMSSELKRTYIVMLVCALISTALSGIPLIYSVILFGLAGTVIFELPGNKVKRNIFFIMIYTGLFIFIGEFILYYVIDSSGIDLNEALKTVIVPVTVSNCISAVVVRIGTYLTFMPRRRKTVYIKVV